MKIGYYHYSHLTHTDKERLFRRSQNDISAILEQVEPLIADVKDRGDTALRDYTKKFDKADLDNFLVSHEEYEDASQNLDPAVKRAIDHCAANVRRFHEIQLERMAKDRHWMVEIEKGVWAGEQITPITSVGLYVPGGKNQYPSAVYMLGIPAALCKVPEITMVTPPNAQGKIGDALLYAAQVSGIKTIYKIGGAQAIAALAYGTQSIKPVKKILGPGSPYVTAAKQLLSGVIDAGMPAGPSESLILCDETADPYNTVLDVLNEAEHGPDSAALLVTHDKKLADYVHEKLAEEIALLPEPQKGWLTHNMAHYSGVMLTETLEQSIEFCNAYAVEHLLVKVKDFDSIQDKLLHAGEILFGEMTPSSFGNYGIGVNHVLPTGGMAASYSCTSIWDFLKRTSLARMDKTGFDSLQESVTTLADYEGFPAHGNVIRKRNLSGI